MKWLRVPEAGQDLEIRVTVNNDRFPWTEEVETPRKALTQFISNLRECTPEQIKMYVCGVLDGHKYEEGLRYNSSMICPMGGDCSTASTDCAKRCKRSFIAPIGCLRFVGFRDVRLPVTVVRER